MADYHKVGIEVSHHIKKYIHYHLSQNPFLLDLDKPIKVDRRHYVGIIIINFLIQEKQKLKEGSRAKQLRYNNKKISGKINVSLLYRKKRGEPNFEYSYYNFDKAKTKDLDMVLDGMFRQELYLFLDSYNLVRDTARKTNEGLSLFYKKYNLTEEDLPQETILKDYRRHKRRTKHLNINHL